MIDWTRIAQLEDDLGADELPGLVSLFLAEVGEAMDSCQPEREPTEEALHFLKGCALTLGFRDLARLASDGEGILKQCGGQSVDKSAIVGAYTLEREELLTRFPQE